MFWLGILIVASIVLVPSIIGLRRTRQPIDSRDSALALYRGQLLELDRDRTLGLLDEAEHDAARIEIQRRLLTADSNAADPELRARPGRRLLPLIGVAVGVPLAAFGLYFVNGHPSLPPQPLANRQVGPDAKSRDMLLRLRQSVASLTPTSPRYVAGHFLLGQVELAEGFPREAAADWRAALDASFSPELAIRLAELQGQIDGHISPDSLALYRRALAVAPPDAPWRMAVEARIAIGEHQENDGQ